MDAARRRAIHDAMVRLSDGDRSAFDFVLKELWPVLLAFVRRGIGGTVDAEDIVQEVLFKICSRIADFDRDRDALSWAFGIASYEIMTYRRRIQRRQEVFDQTSVATHVEQAASQEEQLLTREIEIAFEQAVGGLAEDDRRSLGLLGPKPLGVGATMRKRKQRALDRLRLLWRHIYGES